MLSSLRDGTVPERGVELLTVGRDGWIRSLRQDLEDVAAGDKQVRLINGRYGDGKTHMMAVLRELALKSGFAVSFVTIKADVPLSRWDLLYKAIVLSIESDTSRGAGGLAAALNPTSPDPLIAGTFREKTRTIRSLTSLNSSFAKAAYGYATGQGVSLVDPMDDMLNYRAWLEGNAVSADTRRPLGLQTNIDKSNAYQMFSSLVVLLRHVGYRGFLLLLDEVESTLDQRESVRAAAYDNLRSLIDRRELPAGAFVVCSITPDMLSDEERGIQSYEALWQRLRPVGGAGRSVNYQSTIADLASSPLRTDDYKRLGERIRAVHGVAFDWDANSRVPDTFLVAAGNTAERARSLAVAPTRILVKVVADELDRAHADPHHRPDLRRLPLVFERTGKELSDARAPTEWQSS